MLCQRENDPSTAHVLEHIDAALLNIDRRRLMKILCYAFGVLSQDITDIATSHFTNVLDFKPTRQGSAMQLVAEYNHETFHKHILAPTDIQIGYAFSPATYVQRHGFKITSKTTAATMKSKFI